MRPFVVDTHALVWYLENNPNLGARALAAMSDPDAQLLIPAIALAEFCWIVRSGRTALVDWRTCLNRLQTDSRFAVVPLDTDLVERAMGYPADIEMHDAQIMAVTARHLQAFPQTVLLTRDLKIASSGLVPTIW